MSADRSLEKRLRAYTDAVIRGSAKDADELVAAALADGVSPSALYLGVLVPSQAEVGRLWHAGIVSVPEEHAATQITLRQCDRIRAHFPAHPANGLRVVVASNDGDLHWLGARVVADFFHFDGWEVFFVGQGLPAGELLGYLEKQKPDLFALSITLKPQTAELRAFLGEVSALSPKPAIVLGGAAFASDPALAAALGEFPVAADALSAVDLGRRLCSGDVSPLVLEDVLTRMGDRIQALRKERGLSQQQLADQALLDRAYVCSLEGGKKNVTVGVLVKIASALRVPVDEIMG